MEVLAGWNERRGGGKLREVVIEVHGAVAFEDSGEFAERGFGVRVSRFLPLSLGNGKSFTLTFVRYLLRVLSDLVSEHCVRGESRHGLVDTGT